MDYGLIGAKLGHSYSPAIHARLGDYDYRLRELTEAAFVDLLSRRDFKGLNVTIPYKVLALEHCDALSDTAREVGCVNTLVVRPDGSLVTPGRWCRCWTQNSSWPPPRRWWARLCPCGRPSSWPQGSCVPRRRRRSGIRWRWITPPCTPTTPTPKSSSTPPRWACTPTTGNRWRTCPACRSCGGCWT